MSSRPSDAVAVAVRTGAPLFVADDLMDAEGVMLAVDEEEDDDERGRGVDEEVGNPEEIVGEFRSFLDSIRPEDFSSSARSAAAAGSGAGSHQHPAAHPTGQDVARAPGPARPGPPRPRPAVDHVAGDPAGQLAHTGAALVDRGQRRCRARAGRRCGR